MSINLAPGETGIARIVSAIRQLAFNVQGPALLIANNLSDVANAATSRKNLGIGGALAHQEFPASGTFTTPANTTASTVFKIIITAGGGGGGSGSANPSAGGGGGAGATCIVYVTGLAASTGYAVTVGAAGAAGSTGGSGGTGGTSSVVINAVTYQATGGAGGTGTSTPSFQCPPGAGGTASNGTINVSGGAGYSGIFTSSVVFAGNGGGSFWGSGGAGSYGGGTPGQDATAYGTGGGGSAINNTAGAGKGGIVTFEWIL